MTVTQLEDYRYRRSRCGMYVPRDVPAEQPGSSEGGEGRGDQQQEGPAGAESVPAAAPAELVELGRTERVRQVEAEVAEREELAELYGQYAATHVPSRKTLEMRESSRNAEAQRAERANPARTALRDARAQLVITLLGLVAAVVALGWSTANVHTTAAWDQPDGSVGWWLAWGVEPLISAALLTVMGAVAYLATRQVQVRSRWVAAAQWVPLGYTLVLNCWPSLPTAVLTHPSMEFTRGLVVHSVGPVVVVLLVHALPQLWASFIDLHRQSSSETPDRPGDQGKPSAEADEIDPGKAAELLALARPAVARGEASASASGLARYLRRCHDRRVGVRMSQHLRDVLADERSEQGVAA